MTFESESIFFWQQKLLATNSCLRNQKNADKSDKGFTFLTIKRTFFFQSFFSSNVGVLHIKFTIDLTNERKGSDNKKINDDNDHTVG